MNPTWIITIAVCVTAYFACSWMIRAEQNAMAMQRCYDAAEVMVEDGLMKYGSRILHRDNDVHVTEDKIRRFRAIGTIKMMSACHGSSVAQQMRIPKN